MYFSEAEMFSIDETDKLITRYPRLEESDLTIIPQPNDAQYVFELEGLRHPDLFLRTLRIDDTGVSGLEEYVVTQTYGANTGRVVSLDLLEADPDDYVTTELIEKVCRVGVGETSSRFGLVALAQYITKRRHPKSHD